MSKLSEFLNTPVKYMTRNGDQGVVGDMFGVEVECEGESVDWDGSDPTLLKMWTPHQDGSLRNNHGTSCEWVFNGPTNFKNSVARVSKLFQYFSARKAKLVPSNRTSTHVHFNVGDKHAYQLLNLFILFTIFEDLLDRYCGEDRNGNLFCLSSRHAEKQVDWVDGIISRDYSFAGLKNEWRYCSLNIASVNKFGTVEFRGMRGVADEDEVVAWLEIINELCQYACYTMKNPSELIEQVSLKTPAGFIREVFSKDKADLLTYGLSEYEINNSIYDGLRLVQVLCYKIGAEFESVKIVGKDFWAEKQQELMKDVAPPAPRKKEPNLNDLVPHIDRDAAREHLRRLYEMNVAPVVDPQPAPLPGAAGMWEINPRGMVRVNVVRNPFAEQLLRDRLQPVDDEEDF